MTSEHAREVARGERFEFGENWSRFLTHLNEDRIATAVLSVQELLGVTRMDGIRFLDAGCGSGLFSLAARRLGATVHSFDYDPRSVACTLELRRRYFQDDPEWTVEEASVLDPAYLARLGRFDIVYSWGVLHHTGHMWDALENISRMPADGGRLTIAIYNDQGGTSRRWTRVKRMFVKGSPPVRWLLLVGSTIVCWWRDIVHDLIRFRLTMPTWRNYGRERGMSAWHDLVDWVGGYPFEVAKPEEIFEFFRTRGYQLVKLKTCAGGKGCNEFVFTRTHK